MTNYNHLLIELKGKNRLIHALQSAAKIDVTR